MSENASGQSGSFRKASRACTNCSQRKTKCDEGRPCSLCQKLGQDCTYASPRAKVDSATSILLDRIQQLEDRIFLRLSPAQAANPSSKDSSPQGHFRQHENPASGSSPTLTRRQELDSFAPPAVSDARADHVYHWSVVQDMLHSRGLRVLSNNQDVTSPFLPQLSRHVNNLSNQPSSSQITNLPMALGSDLGRKILDSYFVNVHIFYPVISWSRALKLLPSSWESQPSAPKNHSYADQCLLVMLLLLGMASASFECADPERHWIEATQFLGTLQLETSVEAAQSLFLASIYLASRGRIYESYDLLNAAARKCVLIATRMSNDQGEYPEYPDDFRRLFWVIYVQEGDFSAEISVTSASGIAALDDLVPYPTARPEQNASASRNITSPDPTSELEAYQISTFSAIRRFLHRVSNVMYDPKDAWRKHDHVSYSRWLLKVCKELENHHTSIHHSIPPFLLQKNTPGHASNSPMAQSRHPAWNVARLEGRYYAGIYVFHRPFVEYVLVNQDNFRQHPFRSVILEKCALCFEGCKGFIDAFAEVEANPVTNLFATGMATFTMTLVLIVGQSMAVFDSACPEDAEMCVFRGIKLLQRFSAALEGFNWHVQVLRDLSTSRNAPSNSRYA